MRLWTLQGPGHDITKPFSPTADYAEPEGPFYEIACFLDWDVWIWAFSAREDMEGDLVDRWMYVPPDRDLWTLKVPDYAIKWIGLEAHCTNLLPIESQIADYPDMIREAGDIPVALVRAPIPPSWVEGISSGTA